MKAYPAYKKGDDPWLGDVPKHWDLVSPKWYFSNSSVKQHPEAPLLSATQENGVVPRDEVENRVVMPMKDLENFKLVEKGDFVISLRSFQGGIEYSPYRGLVSPAYTVLKPSQEICCKFYKYLFKSASYINILASKVKSIRDGKNISYDDFTSIEIPLPPPSEQEVIADFLDCKTAQIDTLIKKKQRQIELLQEQRTALLTHAVTKGLNPDVPMKDSGMKWLGKIPSHWYIVPMRRILDVRDGTHDTPDYIEPGGNSIPFVTSKDFEGDTINFVGAKYISPEDHHKFIMRSKVDKGDVLMSMIGGNIGKALMVFDDIEFSIKNVALFKTYGDTALSKYILYYIRSGLLDTQIGIQSRGGAQSFLSLSDIRNLIFFKIPKSEYVAITEFLDQHTDGTDQQIRMIQSQIDLIYEYRTTLISEAVTGKIDVRGQVD